MYAVKKIVFFTETIWKVRITYMYTYVRFDISVTHITACLSVNEAGSCVFFIIVSQTCESELDNYLSNKLLRRVCAAVSHMSPMQTKRTFPKKYEVFLQCWPTLSVNVNESWFRGMLFSEQCHKHVRYLPHVHLRLAAQNSLL